MKRRVQDNIFYVYLYYRKDHTPYYVGKGQRDRAYNRRGHRHVYAPKDLQRVIKFAENLHERDALQLEILPISFYGRKNNGTGILRNLTDGGEGMAGYVMSKASRRRLSKAIKALERTPTHCRNISLGKKAKCLKLSDTHKAQISAAFKGRTFSKKTLQLISAAKTGVPCPKTTGALNGRAVMTLEAVQELRTGGVNAAIAKQLWGISKSQYHRIRRGDHWK